MSSGRVCVRQLFVLRSVVVRSRPVWRSSCVGSCGVRARRLTGGSQRRRIVEVKHKAVDATRAGHGRDTDCARTGDGRASVRLGRIQLSQDGRRRGGGLHTDGKRTTHGLAHGLLTGGGRAGFGQTWTNREIPRWAAVARRRATHGLAYGRATGGTRACLRASDGRATGLSWTIPLRTGDGLLTDSTRTGDGRAAR